MWFLAADYHGIIPTGLREEGSDRENLKPLVPEFLEVMDLLRNLPEATISPSLTSRPKEKRMKSVEEPLTVKARHQSGTPHCTRGKISSIMGRTVGSPPAEDKTAQKVSSGQISIAVGEEEQTTVC